MTDAQTIERSDTAAEAPKKLSRSFRLRRKAACLASEIERVKAENAALLDGRAPTQASEIVDLKAELYETQELLSEALLNLDLHRRAKPRHQPERILQMSKHITPGRQNTPKTDGPKHGNDSSRHGPRPAPKPPAAKPSFNTTRQDK